MKIKISFNLLSMVLAAIVLIEGAAIVVGARQINNIQSLHNGFFASTVAMAGVQLLVLGLVALLAFVLPMNLLKGKEKINRFLSWAPLLVGAVVLVEGLVCIAYASPMVIQGIGGIRGMWLAGFGAQLFFIGSGLVVLKLLSGREKFTVAIPAALLLVIASAGLLLIGIADQAFVSGIGGILKGTLVLGGLQLTILALIGTALIVLGGRSFLGKKFRGHRLGALPIVAVAAIISLEGLILAGFAAPFSIRGIGGMLESTMLLAGIGLAVLGILIPATYYAFEKEDHDTRKFAANACLFLVFLVPFSLLI